MSVDPPNFPDPSSGSNSESIAEVSLHTSMQVNDIPDDSLSVSSPDDSTRHASILPKTDYDASWRASEEYNWSSAPATIDNTKDDVEGDVTAENDWVMRVDEYGREYWYNTITGESSWA